MATPLFSKMNVVAEVIDVVGDVEIRPASIDIIPGLAIEGRSLYDGDIIRSSQDSKIQFYLMEKNIQITIFEFSELRIDCNSQICELKLNYGNLFSESSTNINPQSSIITNTSEIILDENGVTDNITDAWVYLNDNLQGVYELPANFPVLAKGNQTLRVKAGIKLNGISSTRSPYPFYESFIDTIDLKLNETIIIDSIIGF